MTGAVRDLASTYPNRFEIHVAGACSQLWRSNPWIAGFWGPRPPKALPLLKLCYLPYLRTANSIRLHSLTAFHRALSKLLNIPIPVLRPHGDLHLTSEEVESRPVRGRYWVFVAGGKSDIRTKIWPAASAQALVHLLSEHQIRIVQAGARFPGHEHPKLNQVVDLVGRTDLRGMIRLIHHADGVICPVTFAMHAAAALNKPCVVIAGGREPWWWQSYHNGHASHFGPECSPVRVPHRFLHTQGTLDCCRDGGCWKTQISNSPPFDRHECSMPVLEGRSAVPYCMTRVSPEMVVNEVLSYYRDGTLSPHAM